MSGGRFNYIQYDIGSVACEIEKYIDREQEYSKETLDKLKFAVGVLKIAVIMVQRIDWLLSGDDGEETFNQKWEDDLKNIQKEE